MEIRSDQLEKGVTLGNESGLLDIYSGLKTPVSDDVVTLTAQHKREIEDFTKHCLRNFGPLFEQPEQTFAQNNFGIPSLVTRVDCTIVDDAISFYEMEDSPSGLGITNLLIQRAQGSGIKERVLDHYQELTGTIPLVVVSRDRNHGTDDEMIFGTENYHYNPDICLPSRHISEDEIVIVKTIPGNKQSARDYKHLTSQAVAPLQTEGNKDYLLKTGSCKVVTDELGLLHHNGELASQVVKATIGSMAMGVSIFLTAEDRELFGKPGTVRQNRLLRDLAQYVERDGYALTQEFQPPIQVNNAQSRGHAILRVFTLVTGDKNGTIDAEAIGGCYVARPELIVHGASNSVGGAVLV